MREPLAEHVVAVLKAWAGRDFVQVELVERAVVVLGLGALCLFVAYTAFAGLATETRFSFFHGSYLWS